MANRATNEEIKQVADEIVKLLMKLPSPKDAARAHLLAHYVMLRLAFKSHDMDTAIDYVDDYAEGLKDWIRKSSQ